MKNSFVFLCLSVLCFSQDLIFNTNNHSVYSHDFFQLVPYNDWVSFDSTRQVNAFDDFLKKELVFADAFHSGLVFSPDVFIQVEERKRQILINNYYERVVVLPATDLDYINLTKKNISRRLLVHHILIGYEGCSLKNVFSRSKEEALSLAFGIQQDVEEAFLSSVDSRSNIFNFHAEKHSNDPSVKASGSSLGWVSWGRVVPSFQNIAFSLPVGVVSSPVLTDFGYHLIFIEEEGLSNFAYYDKKLVDDMSFKFGVQGVPFDSLRALSEEHDSLILGDGAFSLNVGFANKVVLYLEKELKKAGLRGSKNSYLDVLRGFNEKDILFVFQKKGFGLGWLTSKLKNFPSTRVPIIKSVEDLKGLLSSLIIQQEAFVLAKKAGIQNSPVFLLDFLKNKKNIIYNEYVQVMLSSLPAIDSSLVVNAYNRGVYSKNKYMSPKKAVISELRFSTKEEAEGVLSEFLSGVSFDSLLIKYNNYGGLKKPISFGGKGVLGEAVFNMVPGDVSGLIENANRSFSFFRVERFVDALPLELKNVYAQIEQKFLKKQQDSLKNNLLGFLKNKHSLFLTPKDLLF